MESEFAGAKALVEEAIRGLGVDPDSSFAKGGGDQASWTLQRGSAAILITLTTRQTKPTGPGEVHLRVVSPVMTLPDEEKRTALYKHLLELNAQGLVNAAFGLVGERVVAVSERPTHAMQAEEVSQTIRHLSAVADTYDDLLVRAFGGKLASDPSLKKT